MYTQHYPQSLLHWRLERYSQHNYQVLLPLNLGYHIPHYLQSLYLLVLEWFFQQLSQIMVSVITPEETR